VSSGLFSPRRLPTATLPTGYYYFFNTSFAAPFTAPFATFLAASPIGPQPSSSFLLEVVAGVVAGSFFAAPGFAAPFCFLVLLIVLVFLAMNLNGTPFRIMVFLTKCR